MALTKVTRNLLSTGIDDQSTSTAMTIDSSGNLLVGKSGTTFNTNGVELRPNGAVWATVTGQGAASFNIKGTDGVITDFYKDGSTVGSIGTAGGDFVVNAQSLGLLAVGGTGKYGWNGSLIYPVNDNTSDLGTSSFRFKDLYLSGGVYVGGTTSANYLDDYEEGTWTPAPRPLSGSLSGTIVTEGRYVKIGQLVYLYFYVDIQSISSQTAANDYPVLAGIPFASSSSNSYLDSGVISRNTAFYGSPTATKCFMGGGTIFFGLSQGGTSFPPFAANPPYTTGILSGSITYWTTS